MNDDREYLETIDPTVLASDQIIEALSALDRHPDTFVRWPFPALDALTGPMAPGTIWFVVAASGGGKTTFISSVIDRWQAQGKRVYVMPLETRPHEFRTYLACMTAGVYPGDALSGQLLTLPDGHEQRGRLGIEFAAQLRKPYVDRVRVSSLRSIQLSGLEAGMREAKAFGADVVIVDHIDHIDGGDGTNLYTEAKRVNDGALRMAQDNDMLLVFTSQLNASASKGDYLTKYLPPKTDHVAFGPLKVRNATGMIGLFRPIRKQRADETEDEYFAKLKSARAGTGDIADLLEQHTMGVTAMKLRHYGAREGVKILLEVRQGRVNDMPEKDQWETQGRYPRKVG